MKFFDWDQTIIEAKKRPIGTIIAAIWFGYVIGMILTLAFH